MTAESSGSYRGGCHDEQCEGHVRGAELRAHHKEGTFTEEALETSGLHSLPLQPTKIKLMPISSLSTCPHFKFFANQHSDKSLGENITEFFMRSKMPIVEVF